MGAVADQKASGKEVDNKGYTCSKKLVEPLT